MQSLTAVAIAGLEPEFRGEGAAIRGCHTSDELRIHVLQLMENTLDHLPGNGLSCRITNIRCDAVQILLCTRRKRRAPSGGLLRAIESGQHIGEHSVCLDATIPVQLLYARFDRLA